MKKATYILMSIFVMLLNSFTSEAQTNDPNRLTISAKGVFDYKEHRIILRWLPTNFRSWERGNKPGYLIYRTTVEKEHQKLNPDEIASTLRTYKTVVADYGKFDIDNDMAQVAGQAIYHPEDFKVTGYDDNELFKAYHQEQTTQSRMNFALLAADQNLVTAELSALILTDKEEIEKNRKYQYVVTFLDMNEKEDKELIAGVVEISTYEEDNKEPVAINLTGVTGDKRFELHWNVANESGEAYSSFDIERSEDGGGSWIKINNHPYVYSLAKGKEAEGMMYEGDLPENNQEYQFRIVGKNPFGIQNGYSPLITLKGKPAPMVEVAFIESVTELQKGKLSIKWTFDAAAESKINGFDVWRSKTRDGVFEKINSTLLSTQTRIFEDIKPLNANYYTVVAKDKNGYDIISVPQLSYGSDETPPAKPSGLVGTADKDGKVVLKWSENTEEDLKGYYVFQSNNEKGDYLNMTKIWLEKTDYTTEVEIQTLSENTFFKVAALDFRENLSPLSDVCIVKLPDVVPPSQPVLVSLASIQGGVKLDFRQSESKDIDHHEIQRKADYETSFQTVQTFSKKDTSTMYLDSTGQQMTIYEYQIVAFDDDNNIAVSTSQTIKNFGDGFRQSVQRPMAFKDPYALQALINSNNNTALQQTNIGGFLKVYWEYPEYFSIYDFQLYRKLNGSEPILIKSIDYNEALFKGSITLKDPKVKGGAITLGTGTQQSNATTNNNNGTTAINPAWVFIGQKNGQNVYLDPATNTYYYVPINNVGTTKGTAGVNTTSTSGLVYQGIKGGFQTYYNTVTGQTQQIPIGQSTGNLTHTASVNGYEEYRDASGDKIVWFDDTYTKKLQQQPLLFLQTKGDYNIYEIGKSGSGNTIEIPNSTNPNLAQQGQFYKTHEQFIDKQTNIIIHLLSGTSTNGSGSSTTGTTGSGANPVPTTSSNLKSFLVDDDDYNTILGLNGNLQAVEYQILVRFNDGTTSRMSIPVKPF